MKWIPGYWAAGSDGSGPNIFQSCLLVFVRVPTTLIPLLSFSVYGGFEKTTQPGRVSAGLVRAQVFLG